jgi:hypothetical protein
MLLLCSDNVQVPVRVALLAFHHPALGIDEQDQIDRRAVSVVRDLGPAVVLLGLAQDLDERRPEAPARTSALGRRVGRSLVPSPMLPTTRVFVSSRPESASSLWC